MKKPSNMSNYMRQEMWVDRVEETIRHWEKVQNLEVPEEIKESIVTFMRLKIKRGIKKGTLIKMFMQIAVTALIYIKLKRLDK